jgi:hypothetical protein
LTKAYENSVPSISTVKKWAAEFNLVKNDPRERWSKAITIPETIKKVHNIVLDNREVKCVILLRPWAYRKKGCKHEELGI